MGDDAALFRTARHVLAPEPASVGLARRLVLDQLSSWGATDPQGLAALLTSELVTNAVRFAGHDIELSIAVHGGDALRVEVADDHPALPFVVEAASDREDGRGMLLVATLASAWGTQRHAGEGRKVVWFELPLGSPHAPGALDRRSRAAMARRATTC